MFVMRKNKKGISELISYVLLITLALAMAAAFWFFIKPYAEHPLAEEGCPESVNIVLENYSCSGGIFSFELKNRGLHSVTGVRLKIINSSNEFEYDSLLFLPDCMGMSNCVSCGNDCFGVNENITSSLSYASYTRINKLVIYPVKINEKNELQLCSNAVVKVPVSGCGSGGSTA